MLGARAYVSDGGRVIYIYIYRVHPLTRGQVEAELRADPPQVVRHDVSTRKEHENVLVKGKPETAQI